VVGLLFLSVPAWAQWNLNPEHCNHDGVTETPSFGTRDTNQCLNVDPGNGDSVVPIQSEIFHKKMVPGGCTPTPAGYTLMGNKPDWSHPDCENGCSSILVWDSTIDGYASNDCHASDGIFTGTNYGIEIFWIKDSTLANFWKCDDANDWSGPNGLRCAAGAKSSAHVDGIQLRNTPISDGWFIMQDSAYYNGYNLHGLWQEASPELGSVLLQGLEFGRKEKVLEADTWITDCLTGFAANNGNPSICTEGAIRVDAGYKELWIVDSWSPSDTPVVAKRPETKVVVVNSGCSRSGCGGDIGFNSSGWPHPLSVSGAKGPGTCPNAKIRDSEPVVYCYTSLENAAADHKLAPFVQFSTAGWANPPAGTTQRPAAPVLE